MYTYQLVACNLPIAKRKERNKMECGENLPSVIYHIGFCIFSSLVGDDKVRGLIGCCR